MDSLQHFEPPLTCRQSATRPLAGAYAAANRLRRAVPTHLHSVRPPLRAPVDVTGRSASGLRGASAGVYCPGEYREDVNGFVRNMQI